jgi:hypothetical protein
MKILYFRNVKKIVTIKITILVVILIKDALIITNENKIWKL